MPYNFTPLEYNPYGGYSSTVGSRPSSYGGQSYQDQQRAIEAQAQWDARKAGDQQTQHSDFQNYSGNQFQSLFDAVNSIGASPFTSGDAFYNTPQYTPIGRDTYNRHTPEHQKLISQDSYAGNTYERVPARSWFDQQSYDTARLDNMMGYMGDLGGFFRGLGSPPSQQAQQQIMNNAPSQGPASPMPQVGGSFGVPPQGGNNPFPQFTPTSGGWGQAPTSLFGAGAGNTGVGQ